MPPEEAVERPLLFKVAIWLNALWGAFALVLCSVLAVLTALGGGISSIVAISGEDDAIPVALALFLAAFALLFGIAMSVISLFLSVKAWGMKRFWIWALLIWACLHAMSNFGIVALITIIGSVQALERTKEDATEPGI